MKYFDRLKVAEGLGSLELEVNMENIFLSK